GLVAQLIGLLDQRLLLRDVLLHVRFQTEQEVLVYERFGVVRFDLQRVVDRLDALFHVRALLGFLQPRIAIGLVPVVRRDGVERLRVVGLFLRAFLERVNGLLEFALAIVEAGERRVDRRIGWFGHLRAQQNVLSRRVFAGLLVDIRQREVVGGLG